VDVHELKDRARALVVKGRLEKAEVLYRQVVALVPGDAPAWIRHAETLRRLNRISESVWSYRTAANILRALGHEGRALACLKIALDLRPDDIDLITEIIRIEMHRKRRLERTPLVPAPKESSGSGPLSDFEKPKLALPMLTEVDLRQTSDSVVVSMPQRVLTEPALVDPTAAAPDSPGGPPSQAGVGREAAEASEAIERSANPPTPPVLRASPAPALELEVQMSSMPVWPQVRRLHDREVAIKAGPTSRWLVVSSASPLDVRFEIKLDIDDDAPWLEE